MNGYLHYGGGPSPYRPCLRGSLRGAPGGAYAVHGGKKMVDRAGYLYKPEKYYQKIHR